MDRLQLPLNPSGSSIGEHVSALDLLAARLETLPTRSRWPARVPINSKASFDGDIVHTDEVMVELGGDAWLAMSAKDAASYVRERRSNLLINQARVLEGDDANTPFRPSFSAGAQKITSSEVTFDPLFAPQRTVAGLNKSEAQPDNKQSKDTSQPVGQTDKGNDVNAMPESLRKLVDIVGNQLRDELHLQKSTEGSADNTTMNDEGLPIHEIRETIDGDTIGPMPESSSDASIIVDEKVDDYWSPEAAARRAALRKRLFHEDSDEDDSMDLDESDNLKSPSAPPTADNIKPLESSHPLAIASPVAASAPTAPNRTANPPPKSILKPPLRKKSVSFDDSVPMPPDSPPLNSQPAHRLGVTPVPTLKAPTPGRRQSSEGGFGGFKKGFLSSPSAQSTTSPLPVGVGGNNPADPQESSSVSPIALGKRPSLFAQRRTQASQPSFPKLTDSKPMITMKSGVVEQAPSVGAKSQQASDAPPTVVQTGATQPVAMAVDSDDDDSDEYGDLGDFSDDEEDEYALDEALLAREIALEYHRKSQWQRPIDEDEIDPENPPAGMGGVMMGVPRVSTIRGGEEGGEEPLRIIDPTADDLGHFLRVGRSDDGELVFEPPMVNDDGTDSEGEDDSEQAQDRRLRRARRNETLRRLMEGDYEDRPIEVDPKVLEQQYRKAWEETLPPAVVANTPKLGGLSTQTASVVEESKAAPHAGAASSSSSSKPKNTRVDIRDVVERIAPPQAVQMSVDEPAPPPKKVSRFKARQGESSS